MTIVYLASASPRRKELLESLGLTVVVVPANLDESPLVDESPVELAQRLARQKCEAVWVTLSAEQQADAVVLAADTDVSIDGRIFGKPSNERQAIEMLMQLSGRTHQVMTAVFLRTATDARDIVTITDVTFAVLTPKDCAAYWNVGESKDKAGGYGIQGRAQGFIKEIRGSYSSVVGLPLYETRLALLALGVRV